MPKKFRSSTRSKTSKFQLLVYLCALILFFTGIYYHLEKNKKANKVIRHVEKPNKAPVSCKNGINKEGNGNLSPKKSKKPQDKEINEPKVSKELKVSKESEPSSTSHTKDHPSLYDSLLVSLMPKIDFIKLKMNEFITKIRPEAETAYKIVSNYTSRSAFHLKKFYRRCAATNISSLISADKYVDLYDMANWIGLNLWNLGKITFRFLYKTFMQRFYSVTVHFPPLVTDPTCIPNRRVQATPEQLKKKSAFHRMVDENSYNRVKGLFVSAYNCEIYKHVDWAGYNPIHYSTAGQLIESLRAYLDHNDKLMTSHINAKVIDGFQSSALHLACLGEDKELALDIANLLIKHDISVHQNDALDVTPLFLAVEEGHDRLVELLLRTGARVDLRVKESQSSVLHFAMKSCNEKVIKQLIESGADINAVNSANRTPIHEAAAFGCIDGFKLLIQAQGRDIKDAKTPTRSSGKYSVQFWDYALFGATPLHFAAKYDQLPMVEYLLMIQADPKVKDEFGMTPGDYAIKKHGKKSQIGRFFRNL